MKNKYVLIEFKNIEINGKNVKKALIKAKKRSDRFKPVNVYEDYENIPYEIGEQLILLAKNHSINIYEGAEELSNDDPIPNLDNKDYK